MWGQPGLVRCVDCRVLILFSFLLVDLCHPLLVGILSDNEEEDVGGTRDGSSVRREVFLCIKQGLALEVDVKHGRERCRLELSSLARVKTTEAPWTRGVRQGNQFKDVFTPCLLLCIFTVSLAVMVLFRYR